MITISSKQTNNNILCNPTIVAQQAVGFVWVAVELFPHQRPALFL